MSAAALEAALASLGVCGRVEARGPMALLVAHDAALLGDDARRRAVVTLAREHGFTTVALELVDELEDRAALSRD